jgi:indoleamine 2,3-dioxygenase
MKLMHPSEYQIDPVRGFLPAENPLEALTDVYYHPWEDTVGRLPKLLGTKRIRYFLGQLPLLSANRLTSPGELNRAMTLLSYMGHAYIWGEETVVDRLPANIAVPWHAVAKSLGRPPVLSYASHALYNWRLIEPHQPIELGNLERLENFYGAIDEDWFVLVHVAIEAKAGPSIAKLIQAQKAISARDSSLLLDALESVRRSLTEMVAVLHRMPENCDPYVYYNKMRRYIFGWINPALPDGVYYEGVDEWTNQPQKFRGETGAQSAIVPAIDAMMGIPFERDNPFYEHLIELRNYMPPLHRKLIEDLEENSSEADVKTYILEYRYDMPELVIAYNEILEQNYRFRNMHLKYARDYINKQVQTRDESPTNLGTGGTPFMDYLSRHLSDVLAQKIA